MRNIILLNTFLLLLYFANSGFAGDNDVSLRPNLILANMNEKKDNLNETKGDLRNLLETLQENIGNQYKQITARDVNGLLEQIPQLVIRLTFHNMRKSAAYCIIILDRFSDLCEKNRISDAINLLEDLSKEISVLYNDDLADIPADDLIALIGREVQYDLNIPAIQIERDIAAMPNKAEFLLSLRKELKTFMADTRKEFSLEETLERFRDSAIAFYGSEQWDIEVVTKRAGNFFRRLSSAF